MVLACTLILLAAAAATLYFAPAQWAGRLLPGDSVVDDDAVALLPGTALATSSRVEAEGIEAFEPDGEILLLTVSIDSDLTVLDWIKSSMDDAIGLRTRESVYGDRSDTEQREHNRHLMESSKDIATIVALEHLGVHAADFTGVLFFETVADGTGRGPAGAHRCDPVHRWPAGDHRRVATSSAVNPRARHAGCDFGAELRDRRAAAM